MTAQHTPGPWIICDDGGLCIHSPEYGSVGQVWTHLTMQSDGSVEGANARLIAAAPLMLEALKTALDYLESECPHESTDDCTSCALICYDARAAIAAATGKDA